MNKKRQALKRRLKANRTGAYSIDRCGLYGIKSLSPLAALLWMSNKQLRALAALPEYVVWVDRSKPLKPREIQDPRGLTEKVHYRLYELLDRVRRPDFLHSATRKRSIVTNARKHASADPCVMTDMKMFYQSTTTRQVATFFRDDLNVASDLADKLARLCTVDGHLPTGSPLSPLLAYWVHHRVFDQVHSLCQIHGVTMTAYYDDLTFSGKHATLAFLHRVKRLLRLRGLHTHKDKSFGTGAVRHVTGVAADAKGLHVPNHRLHGIVNTIDQLAQACTSDEVKSLSRSVAGRIASASAISRAAGKALATRRNRLVRA